MHAATAPRTHPAHAALREATAAAHQRLDALLAHGLHDADSYAAYVRAMHRFVSDYEIALGEMPRRSLWLARDLMMLRQIPLPPRGAPAPVSNRDQRLGWEYVLIGSSLGARLLQRDAKRLGYDADSGALFLSRHADGDGWRGLMARMQALPSPNERQQAALRRGGLDAFSAAETCFHRALEKENTA